MSAATRQAELKLNFLIVGGGIAGLATSFVLARAGHRVHVLEKYPGLGAPAGGLRITPNLSKILVEWFGAKLMDTICVTSRGTLFLDLMSGAAIGEQPWASAVAEQFGGEFLLVPHVDLHRAMYDLAKSVGVRVDFNSKVASVTAHTEEPSVTLENGETLKADIIIGADGHRSMVRSAVLQREDDAVFTGHTMFAASIPVGDHLDDPEVKKWFEKQAWPVFMAPTRIMGSQPAKKAKEYQMHIMTGDTDEYSADVDETWGREFPTDKMPFHEYGPVVAKFMAMATKAVRINMMHRAQPIEEWTDDENRVVLLGEAAFPIVPGGTYGASMAVEDAVIFGTIFSHLSSWDQVGSFMEAYQEMRQKRRQMVHETDLKTAEMLNLSGEDRKARDEDLARGRDDWEEALLKDQFDAIAEVFCYDARDAADEWWMDWGRLAKRAKMTRSLAYGEEDSDDCRTMKEAPEKGENSLQPDGPLRLKEKKSFLRLFKFKNK